MSGSERRIRIVADQNIALPAHLPDSLEVVTLPGREIQPHHVVDADALLVRSVTRVNQALLNGSSVRFVATATSGTDHLDLDWLAEAGIAVADAAGANAGAVTDYVLSCLASLLQDQQIDWPTLRVAVVGVGRVGGQLAARLQALGVECVGCDPFQQVVDGLRYVSLDEALQADVVCLHTPLTVSGPHPTWHMLDAERLAALAPQTILINAGRGEVVDNQALKLHAQQFPERRFILDVWENEPCPAPELVRRAYIATPHIAGYSLESKQLAGQRVLHALYHHFSPARGADPAGGAGPAGGAASNEATSGSASGESVDAPSATTGVAATTVQIPWAPTRDTLAGPTAEQRVLVAAILQCFSSKVLSARFSRDYLAAESPQQAAETFDRYRREQLGRREFSAHPVALAAPDTPGTPGISVRRTLQAAGFVVTVPEPSGSGPSGQ